MVSSTLGADAEASRFKIFVPTVVGKDVEITALAKNKDGDVSELWIATYTNTYDAGTSAPETPDNEPGNDEPNTSTADGTAIMFMVAAAAVVATVLLKKRAF